MRGPAPAPPRFIALGFPERVIMRCVRALVQKKSDAVGITLSANPCTGARVAPQRCPVFRYSQKQFHDTITTRICQAANWPPIMALTGRELRPCWPGITAICIFFRTAVDQSPHTIQPRSLIKHFRIENQPGIDIQFPHKREKDFELWISPSIFNVEDSPVCCLNRQREFALGDSALHAGFFHYVAKNNE